MEVQRSCCVLLRKMWAVLGNVRGRGDGRVWFGRERELVCACIFRHPAVALGVSLESGCCTDQKRRGWPVEERGIHTGNRA